MSKWQLQGRHVLDLAAVYRRMLRVNVQSAGVSILCGNDKDDADLIYSGSGSAVVRAMVAGSRLFILPYQENGIWQIEVPELRFVEPGWLREPSLADLNPPPFGQISPEIQAVMDRMNRNAILREQALLRALRGGAL